MGNEEEQRAGLLRRLLAHAWRAGAEPTDLSSEELTSVVPYLHGSGAAGLAWWRVKHTPLADLPVARDLRDAYRLQWIRNSAREQEIHEVVNLLRSQGVEPILVKGWAAARAYGDPGLRPYGDIDLLVPREQRARAEKLVEGRDRVDFDHFELDIRNSAEIEAIYVRSQLVDDIRIMAWEDHLALLCLHFLKHGAWRPLWLCDIAAALEAQPGGLDWHEFLSRENKWGQAIQCCVTLAREFLGARVVAPAGLPSWFIPAVTRAWSRALYTERPLPEAIAASWLRLPQSLRHRWPDPISATLYTGAPFNSVPRVVFQVGYYGVLAQRYLKRLCARAGADSAATLGATGARSTRR